MTLPDPGRSRALLIGASRFADPELPDLPAVRNNLDGLAACLRDPGLWGLPAVHCTVVADPESGVALVDAVQDVAAEADDTLVIYYAGHGLVHPRTLGLLLAVRGSSPARPHTAVPYDQVRDNVLDARARRKVVILDCCYSGRAFGGMTDPTAVVADQASVEGTYLLVSVPPNKQALSPPGEPYTAFTGALLTLLTEGVPNGPEHLQLGAIYRHVRDTLTRRGLPEPQLRVDNTAGELALVRNRWGRQPAATLPFRVEPARAVVGDRYQLSDEIAHDNATEIRIGTDIRSGERVTVSLVASPADERPAILTQARQAAKLRHPAIVRVLDAGLTPRDGRELVYVVAEYVPGRSLRDVPGDYLAADPYRAATTVVNLCEALAYAHSKGVTHGGVDLDSVIVDQAGGIKLRNFGINLAPDEESDVEAVAHLLHQLVVGLRRGGARSGLPPWTPEILVDIVNRATSDYPHMRYHDAWDLHDELCEVAEDTALAHKRPLIGLWTGRF